MGPARAFSFCRPANGGGNQSEFRSKKVRAKIARMIPLRVSARRNSASKAKQFSFSFNGYAQNLFSFKETIFAGFASLLTQRRAASHPCRAFGAESRRAKIPSPRPPSFLPACWKPPAIFSDGGGTLNWVVGGVRFQVNYSILYAISSNKTIYSFPSPQATRNTFLKSSGLNLLLYSKELSIKHFTKFFSFLSIVKVIS